MHENRLVVVGHYYANREGNLSQIVSHLTDLNYRVLVWDNNPGHRPGAPQFLYQKHPQVQIVHCPNNPIHGRYLAVLIYTEMDYFLFQDDDMTLPGETIDKLFSAAESGPKDKFYGLEGRKLGNPRPYWDAERARFPEKADMVIRAYACHRTAVMPGLNEIARLGIHPGRSETILMSFGKSEMVDVGDGDWTNLPEKSGLSHDIKTHNDEIEAFFLKYVKA